MSVAPDALRADGICSQHGRLERLREPNPEELAKEIAEAERNGDKLLVLPGGLRVLLKLYGREPAAKE